MVYVLVSATKKRYALDDIEYQKVLKAIEDDDKAVMVQGSVIPLHITPEVMPFEVWFPQENERLALSGKRLCKKCLCIMDIQDKCSCWKEMGKGEVKSGFQLPVLPENVKQAVKQIAKKKSFPKVVQADIDREELKPGQVKKKRIESGSDDNGDFHIDDNGEKQYA